MRIAAIVFSWLASTSYAGFVVTHATVDHLYSGVPPLGESRTMIDGSPGNHFDTFDGYTGAKLSLDETEGSLRLDAKSVRNAGEPGQDVTSSAGVYAVIDFTIVGGSFFTGVTSPGIFWSSSIYELVQLSTGESLTMSIVRTHMTFSGDMRSPIGVGDYRLTAQMNMLPFVGPLAYEHTTMIFIMAPEPTSLGAVALVLFAARARRRDPNAFETRTNQVPTAYQSVPLARNDTEPR